MTAIDQVSSALGTLQSDVKHIKEAVDEIRDELYPRVERLEESKAKRDGIVIGVSAISGGLSGWGLSTIWKALAAKFGFG